MPRGARAGFDPRAFLTQCPARRDGYLGKGEAICVESRAVALLSVSSTGCGDDVEPVERTYSVVLTLTGPDWATGPSRHWIFDVAYYRFPRFPERNCVVAPYRAEVVFPSGGVTSNCSSGCIAGHACSYGCEVDLGACEVWRGDTAPKVEVFYKNFDCPHQVGLNTALTLSYPLGDPGTRPPTGCGNGRP